MATEPDKFKMAGAKLETPGVIKQVETHLIFGPISRHVPFAYVILAGAIVSLIAGFFATNKPVGQYVGSILDKLIYLVLPFLLLRLTLRQQAIIGWMAVKFGVGIAAFMMATLGSAVSFQHGYSDAVPNLILGLIWIPGVEFIPRVTPHQRYVTLARIALSIPCIYFGIKSGNWHW
jgi:hypothetical protein